MIYDALIGNSIRRGLSYAELIMQPIEADTLVRRNGGSWIRAHECIELSHIVQSSYGQCGESIEDHNYETSEYAVGYANNEYLEPDSVNSCSEYNRYGNEILHIDSNNAQPEERIFVPTEEYFKCRQKRKTALIGVLTFGLAGLMLVGIGNTWRGNIFAGTSFMQYDGMAFICK